MADIPNRKFYTLVSEPNAPTPSFPSDTEEPQNPVNPPGSGGVAIRHNSTLEKDGGDPTNDFFGHLTEEELERVQNLPSNFSGNHSDLNLDDGTNPHGTTADDVGLGAFEGYTPETLPISDDTQEALDLKADKEDLEPVSFDYPISWVFTGSKTYNLPDGGSENWLLSKLLKATWRTQEISHAIETYPDTKELKLKDSWDFDNGEIIRIELRFIYN